jgi:hypothetical protein
MRARTIGRIALIALAIPVALFLIAGLLALAFLGGMASAVTVFG